MAYQLPDGSIIMAPRKGRFFIIDGVKHPEKNLGVWSASKLASLGIQEVVVQPASKTVTLESAQNAKAEQLNIALHSYIEQDYDVGTQLTFQALYVRGGISSAAFTKLENVWDWIQIILGYYYEQKEAIYALTVVEDVQTYSWDFDQFTSIKPNVTLRSLMAT